MPETEIVDPIAAPTAEVVTDWSHLDSPDRAMLPDTPDTFVEDEPIVVAAAKAEPEAKVEDTPVVEAKAGPVVDVDPAVKASAEEFAKFDRALKENPIEAAKIVIEGMSVSQKVALLKELGVERKYADFNIAEYEPGTSEAMEKALKDRWEDIDSIPQLLSHSHELEGRMKETRDFAQSSFEQLVPHITEGAVMSELALAKIDAICDALGITLPDPDFAAVGKEIGPGVKYRDAVRKVVNYGTAVEMAKQARTARPSKSIDTTKREVLIDDNDDAVAIARKLGTLPRR